VLLLYKTPTDETPCSSVMASSSKSVSQKNKKGRSFVPLDYNSLPSDQDLAHPATPSLQSDTEPPNEPLPSDVNEAAASVISDTESEPQNEPSPSEKNKTVAYATSSSTKTQSTQENYDASKTKAPKPKIIKGLSLSALGKEETLPVRLPLSPEVIAHARSKVRLQQPDYSHLYREYGYRAVIEAAYEEAKKAGHPCLRDTEKGQFSTLKVWMKHGLWILGSCHTTLLKALYEGNLSRQIRNPNNGDLQHLFSVDPGNPEKSSEWVQRSGQAFAPCAYVRELVASETGDSPTADDLYLVIQALRGYVSGDKAFNKQNAAIDRLSSGTSDERDIQEGYHYFFGGVSERAFLLHTFCFALQARLDDIPEDERDLAMAFTLRYIGYARSASDPFEDYSRNKSVSWLTDLVLAVCRHLFGNKYMLDQHVICFFTSHRECQIGEELFTRCALAYAESGTGLGVYPAGLSVSTADLAKEETGLSKKLWEATWMFRNRHFFDDNIQLDSQRWDKYDKYVATQKQAKRQEQEERRQRLLEEHTKLEADIRALKETRIPSSELQETFYTMRRAHASAVAATRLNSKTLANHLRQSYKKVRQDMKAHLRALRSDIVISDSSDSDSE
jgi:hypothetical protein